ncbi:hypothetical protein Fmac_009276 [Flemingia macrophylla]|uniref:Uncharacterized protein n=1 Tax=Flemingia macrophylla TaxID=520843 RepID=A0ABD1MZS3_9FABA
MRERERGLFCKLVPSQIPMNSSRREHGNWKLTVAMGLRGNGSSTQTQVSARKLAAAAWWNFSLSADHAAAASHPYYSPSPYSIFQLANGKNLKIMPPRDHNSGGNKVTKRQLRRPITILRLRSRNGLRRESAGIIRVTVFRGIVGFGTRWAGHGFVLKRRLGGLREEGVYKLSLASISKRSRLRGRVVRSGPTVGAKCSVRKSVVRRLR